MTTPKWRFALERAMEANARERSGRFAQIATVARDGAPACRTIVIRGFRDAFARARNDAENDDDDDFDANANTSSRAHFGGAARDDLVFTCDRRSAKCEEIARDDRAELAWYFAETREQFRVRGRLTTTTTETTETETTTGEEKEMRVAVWRTMSAKAREQFTWANPGEVRVDDGASTTERREASASDESDDAGENFAMVSLRAERVDHLALRTNEREVHEIVHGVWVTTRVNP